MPRRREAAAADFCIGGLTLPPGTRATHEFPVANLYTHTPVTVPVQVVHGSKPGPTMFVSAALHGDEIIGVEIIRRLLRAPALKRLSGTLLAVPVVNTMAFLHRSRYLPDRRDLNRSFPGSETGSLAARLANLFLREIVERSQYGIDLHTGAVHRPNLPQIRADFDQPENLRLAKAFGAPVLLRSSPASGTLREVTTQRGIPVLLYESSEALRFDETCIRIGVRGVLAVLREVGMLPASTKNRRVAEPVVAHTSTWARAPGSGVLRAAVDLGDEVRTGQTLAIIGDPLGESEVPVLSPVDGLVIGRLNLPLVHEGDALFNIARVGSPTAAAEAVDKIRTDSAEAELGPSGEPPLV